MDSTCTLHTQSSDETESTTDPRPLPPTSDGRSSKKKNKSGQDAWGLAISEDTDIIGDDEEPVDDSNVKEEQGHKESGSLLRKCQMSKSKDQTWEDVLKWINEHPTTLGDEAKVEDENGNLPIHFVCEDCKGSEDLKDDECRLELVKLLFYSHPEGMKKRNGDGKLPLDLVSYEIAIKLDNHILKSMDEEEETLEEEGPSKMQASLAVPESNEAPSLLRQVRFHILLHSLKPTRRRNFLRDNIDSPTCQEWVNAMSCQPRVVFLKMFDITLRLIWFALSLAGIEEYLISGVVRPGFIATEIVFMIIFYVLEMQQMFHGISDSEDCDSRNSQSSRATIFQLLTQPDSLLDLCIISIAAATTITTFVTIESSFRDIEDQERAKRQNFIFVGFLHVLLITWKLKSASLSFATFFCGIKNLMLKLLPFIAVTAITLIAFAFWFFVQRHSEDFFDEDGKELPNPHGTLQKSILAALTGFFDGPGDIENWLDILFALAIVVVLLNVVIAIVSNIWDDASREAKKEYWEYRVDFLTGDAAMMLREPSEDNETWEWEKKIYDRISNVKNSTTTNKGWTLDETITFLSRVEEDDDVGYVYLKLLLLGMLYIFIALGFVTCGYTWPRCFRVWAFGYDEEQDTDERVEEIQDRTIDLQENMEKKIVDVQDSMKDLQERMEKITNLILALQHEDKVDC